jgi:hypothetical protein
MSDVAALRQRLIAIPDVEVPARLDGLDEAIAYLASDAAAASLAEDSYWPKWDSPWWQMVLLFELGLARRIPERAVRAMVAALEAYPVHTFPIRPEEWPPGVHPSRAASCHCALGSIDQVLAACGVDVDADLPWVREWYERYQMRDGGLNCDEKAYLVEDECPSSMVGTVPPFEALLRRGPSRVADRAAQFLIDRELVHGSSTRHNAEERDSAPKWLAPAFPRFYLYDVLRGATALVRWATAGRQALPLRAIEPAFSHLATVAGDGVVRIGRQVFAGIGTWRGGDDGTWRRDPVARTFPLLDAVSQVGAASAPLTAEWRATRHALIALIDAGRVTE